MDSTPAEQLIAGKSLAFEELPFPRALGDLKQRGASGTLHLRVGPMEKNILLKDGIPAHVDSNIAEESLERLLVKRGELEESVAFEALNTAAASGRGVADVLVNMGALRPDQLFTAMKRSMGTSILRAFAWTRGEVSYDAADADLEHKILLKVSPGPLVVRGVCSFSSIELVRADFPERERPHSLSAEAASLLPELRLNTGQSRMAHALMQTSSAEQMAALARVDTDDAVRLLYALVVLGVAVPAEAGVVSLSQIPQGTEPSQQRPTQTEPAAKPAPVAAPEPAPVAAPEPAPAPESAPEPVAAPRRAARPSVNFRRRPSMSTRPLGDTEKEAIDRMYLTAKSRDYFELLSVERTCSFAQVKRSFLSLCGRFSPMSYRGRELGDHGERLEELFLTLVTAFSTLAVTQARKQYVAQLDARPGAHAAPGGGAESAEAPRNAFAVNVSSSACAAVKTAATFINAGEPAAAVETLNAALSDDPGDPSIPAYLGYAVYLMDPVTRLSDAMRCLGRASTMDSRCLEAFLFLGRIFDMEQDLGRAVGAYRECLRIDADNLEANQAVSRLESRLR